MNAANPWSKFVWNDWENDPALRLCSFAAQGLWMRLLCVCAKSDPVGYLTVDGHSPSHDDLALLIGRPAEELLPLLTELSDRGVYSRDAKGRLYSRRLVRDAKASAEARKTGKLGGNPSLLKDKEKTGGDNPQDKDRDNTHKPESRIHKPERITPESPPVVSTAGTAQPKPKGVVHALSADWSLPEEWRVTSRERNWGSAAIDRQAVKFKQYFGFGKGSDIRRSEKGWRQTWLNWLDRALKIDPDAATFGKADSPAVPTSYPPLPEAVRQKLKGHFAFNESFIQRWLAPCVFDLDAGTIVAPSRFQADYLETHYGSSLRHALGDELQILVSKKIGAP